MQMNMPKQQGSAYKNKNDTWNYCRIYDKNYQNTAGHAEWYDFSPSDTTLDRPLASRQFSNDDTAQSAPTILWCVFQDFVARERLACLVFFFPCHWRKDLCTTWTWYSKGAEVYFFFVGLGFVYLMNLGKPQGQGQACTPMASPFLGHRHKCENKLLST